ncbi:hypothetical protein ACHAWF_018603 [Thalassiosira exigua]
MGKQGYKLTSSAGDGPKTCAFFLSEKGCRNGAGCKFSHEAADGAAAPPSSSARSSPSVASSSVISSETESDGEIVEDRAGAYASLGNNQVDIRSASRVPPPACVNPFVSSPAMTAEEDTPAAQQPQQQQPQPKQPSAEKKSKKKRKNEGATAPAPGENVFDLGKAKAHTPPKNTGAAATAAAAASPPSKKLKQSAPPPINKERSPPDSNATAPHGNVSGVASFRSLQLPVAAFSLPVPPASAPAPKSPRPPSPQHEEAPPPPPLPLPVATAAHLKWKDAVVATQEHDKYANAFSFDRTQQEEMKKGISTPELWFTTKPYGDWCASNPASIAIDCEMCETRDPVTGATDPKALCRLSVVNADNPEEVLLDTLVKPEWPVSDYRTWVNGISKKDLADVKFTLEHAQTFMAALCSEQTVVVGHAVHNDLLSLRMVHHCNADTAMLFRSAAGGRGSVSLKNLAHGVLKGRDMPEVHDSVNDARVALECAEDWVAKDGDVEPIEKVFTRTRDHFGRPKRNSRSGRDYRSGRDSAGGNDSSGGNDEDEDATSFLLVHRLPKGTLSSHIGDMLVVHSFVKPKDVPEVAFSGSTGKCLVEFASTEHAELAYATIAGEEREDKSGKKQKRVGLKGGGYVNVRKMRKER